MITTDKGKMMINQCEVAVAVAVYNPLYPYSYYLTEEEGAATWLVV
jgi:hypothetical protein